MVLAKIPRKKKSSRGSGAIVFRSISLRKTWISYRNEIGGYRPRTPVSFLCANRCRSTRYEKSHDTQLRVFKIKCLLLTGYRIRLHFDGYSDSHDYWLNADSENLFPCGWCEKNGQKLRPPKHYDLPQNNQPSSSPPSSGQQPAASSTHTRIFSWPQYLKFTSSVAAPRHLFISMQHEVTFFFTLTHSI